jgi:hypothetical protein
MLVDFLKGNHLDATATLPWLCQVKGPACRRTRGVPTGVPEGLTGASSHRGEDPKPRGPIKLIPELIPGSPSPECSLNRLSRNGQRVLTPDRSSRGRLEVAQRQMAPAQVAQRQGGAMQGQRQRHFHQRWSQVLRGTSTSWGTMILRCFSLF